MGEIISGKLIAKEFRKSLKEEVNHLKERGITPKLTVIVVGNDPASAIYVKNKEKTAKKLGIDGVVERYLAETDQETIINRIKELNNDPMNDGILVQLPLPSHFDEQRILELISPEKDVDGFHPINIGKLVSGDKCLMPCTPSGIMHLIESTGMDITGKDAVVVGRSNIVGKPITFMLLKKHATVTVCHSRTVDLPEKVRNADILVAAIGKPEFIRGDWIKPGAVVIDVGINRLENGKVIGDIEFETAKNRASHITPVPGGVGPMTIAMLMKNTIEASKWNRGTNYDEKNSTL